MVALDSSFCPLKIALLEELFCVYLNNGTGNDCPKQRMEMEVFEGTMSSWRRSPVNFGGTLPMGSGFVNEIKILEFKKEVF